ncbi:MAG: M48 family metalloprotease [Burkholderiaceae bacterium]|jgi:predicted Zn-dependent protease|nr:M48 family metalloprotease [Burkholderiaceae bacterium]
MLVPLPSRALRGARLAAACTALALAPNLAPAQNVMNLLNSLGSSVGGGSSPGGLLGTLSGNTAAPAAQGDDLISLLTRSTETIDEASEIKIGRQLAAVLLGSKPLHPDARLQAYVNRLGRWISLQSERPNLPWTFVVLDDNGYNAFAAPGGYVFVTKGLIDRCADESELAGILAHEITHVTQRHHLQAMRKTAQSGLLTQLVASQIKTNAVGNLVASQVLALGRNLYARGLDQGDEFEADRRGVALAASSGFDPFGLPAALQVLRAAAPGNPMFTLSLATHPPAEQRLDQLQLAMGNRLDGLTGTAAVTVAQRLQGSGGAAPAAAAAAGAAAVAAPAAAAEKTKRNRKKK